MRSYSVMVITQDFEFCDPGSSPGRTCIFSNSFLLKSLNHMQIEENKLTNRIQFRFPSE